MWRGRSTTRGTACGAKVRFPIGSCGRIGTSRYRRSCRPPLRLHCQHRRRRPHSQHRKERQHCQDRKERQHRRRRPHSHHRRRRPHMKTRRSERQHCQMEETPRRRKRQHCQMDRWRGGGKPLPRKHCQPQWGRRPRDGEPTRRTRPFRSTSISGRAPSAKSSMAELAHTTSSEVSGKHRNPECVHAAKCHGINGSRYNASAVNRVPMCMAMTCLAMPCHSHAMCRPVCFCCSVVFVVRPCCAVFSSASAFMQPMRLVLEPPQRSPLP